MVTKFRQQIHLLESRPRGTSPKVVVMSLAGSEVTLTNIHISTCWNGYGHQISAAGTILREESSGHSSPGSSDVITMQSCDCSDSSNLGENSVSKFGQHLHLLKVTYYVYVIETIYVTCILTFF